jgi:hypothetical protein
MAVLNTGGDLVEIESLVGDSCITLSWVLSNKFAPIKDLRQEEQGQRCRNMLRALHLAPCLPQHYLQSKILLLRAR